MSLVIFEGPDGSGKSTTAQAFADVIGAKYTHHGPYPDVKEISVRYLESMMPAILRRGSVVLDRCWVSEVPYGLAFRGGEDRIGVVKPLLEGFANRANALYVRCDPTWEQVERNFVLRKGTEYLKTIDQIFEVWKWYHGDAHHPHGLRTLRTNLLDRSVNENIDLIKEHL